MISSVPPPGQKGFSSPWEALSDILLVLLLTIAAGVSAGWIGQLLAQHLNFPMLLVLLIQGLILLGGLYLLLSIRGQSWRDIRLKPLQIKDLGRALLALLLVFIANAVFVSIALQIDPSVVEGHHQGLSEIASMMTLDLPLIAIAGVMLFVGFYEEVVARGLLLQRSQILLAGVWAPVLLSSILFGLGHAYQGWLGVFQTAVMGIVLAHLTLRWQTLWPAILAHASVNTLSFTLLRYMGSAM